MNNISTIKIPRIESLHHRLQHAKGPDGQPLALLDELMVFLEDPPADVRDRWQAGAEWCAAQGVETSRIAVWRFYRTHVLEWRLEQAPAHAKGSEEATAKLEGQARHLVALRAVESLLNPNLPPHVLIGLVLNENRRQELQLAREKFGDQVDARARLEQRQKKEAEEKKESNQSMARAYSALLQYSSMASEMIRRKGTAAAPPHTT